MREVEDLFKTKWFFIITNNVVQSDINVAAFQVDGQK